MGCRTDVRRPRRRALDQPGPSLDVAPEPEYPCPEAGKGCLYVLTSWSIAFVVGWGVVFGALYLGWRVAEWVWS